MTTDMTDELCCDAATSRYLSDTARVAAEIDPDAVDTCGRLLRSVRVRQGTVYTLGNGGGASTAQHLACDLSKPRARGDRATSRAVCLNDSAPLLTALVNDFGQDESFTTFLAPRLVAGDALVVFSVHGGGVEASGRVRSGNLTNAIRMCNQLDVATIGISGWGGGAFARVCDACVVVPSRSTPIVENVQLVVAHRLAELARRDAPDEGVRA